MSIGAAGETMTAESIAIIGPGRMGVGIATATLMAGRGCRVTLIDSKKRPAGGGTEALTRATTDAGFPSSVQQAQ